MPATLIALHFVTALVAPVAAKRLGPRVFLLCAVAPAVTLVAVMTQATGIVDGDAVEQTIRWVDGLGLELGFRLDALGLVMVALVSGIGVLIFAYSRWYFSPQAHLGRFAAVLTAFSGSMLGLVVANDLLTVFLFWELTSVTSYLLIGHNDTDEEARSAALAALLVTGLGGLAMLAGFVILGEIGITSLSALVEHPPSGALAGAGAALLLVGAFTKSAQAPFHFWLPGAMAAPTPVSAYLHSATMVKAGVYLVARAAPGFAHTIAWWRPVVIGVGATTMLIGGYRALRQHDLKLLLAFGTVSQLGFIMLLVGTGDPHVAFAGIVVLFAHGLFKAALFLTAGIVDHQAHSRDIRLLSGLARVMPATFVTAALAVASMAGVIPLLGFIAKEEALASLLDGHFGGTGAALTAVVAGSVLTTAYGARYLWGAFATKPERGPAYDVEAPKPALLAPAALLAVASLVFGLAPRLVSPLLSAAGGNLYPELRDTKLYLWHGFNTALLLSVVALGVGLVLFGARRAVELGQERLHWPFGAHDGYRASIRALARTAGTVTGVMQNGSLPAYLLVILTTATVLPGVVLVSQVALPDEVVVADSALQGLVAGLVLGMAVATALARRRLHAVLSLGAAGFGVAVLFLIEGAPDLALTQLLIEMLSVAVFVLVLRHLPERFEPVPWRAGQIVRALVAGTAGVFVTIFSLTAAAERVHPPISDEIVRRALPEAGGRNVVNTILVDFRGFDTLGEITVLAVAALGIASLVLAGRGSHR